MTGWAPKQREKSIRPSAKVTFGSVRDRKKGGASGSLKQPVNGDLAQCKKILSQGSAKQGTKNRSFNGG